MFRLAVRSTVTALLMLAGVAAQADGPGLKAPPGESIWPRWQARVTVAMADPLWRQGRSEESDGNQRLESLGLLGDYYFGRSLIGLPTQGFRATSGLIFGTTSYRALSGDVYGRPAGAGVTGMARGGLGLPPGIGGYFGNDGSSASGTVPYVGLGYSTASPRGGWGFSADVGLIAQSPGAVVRLGRVFSGTQTLDDMLRDMRFAPLLNVGVSYSF